MRGEYRYSDFGHMGDSPAPTSMGVYYTADRHLDQQQVQVGVSYRFNDGVMPPVAAPTVLADLPSFKGPAPLLVSPPPLWTGLHAGVNVGGSFDVNARSHSVAADLFDDFNPAAAGAAAAASVAREAEGTYANLIGGGQFGYDHQFSNNMIAGAEADLQGAPGSSPAIAFQSAATDPIGTPTTMLTSGQFRHSLDWLGTLRGRIGILATPALLVYGSGGLAYGGVSLSTAYATADLAGVYGAGSGYASHSDARLGWTGGGGVEWMFAPAWSAKLEYLYTDLGTASANTVVAGTNSTTGAAGYAYAASTTYRFTSNLVRAGLNYHFNWSEPVSVVAKY